MKDFFISYTKDGEKWAEWIAGTLEQNGYSTLIQAWDFRPGNDFVQMMNDGTTKCRRTIAVLTEDYQSHAFTQLEAGNAIARDATGHQRLLIPIRVAPIKPTGLLKSRIYIDLVGLKEVEAKKYVLDGVSDTKERGSSSLPPYPDHDSIHPPQAEKATFPATVGLTTPQWQEKLAFLREQLDAITDELEKTVLREQLEQANRMVPELSGRFPQTSLPLSTHAPRNLKQSTPTGQPLEGETAPIIVAAPNSPTRLNRTTAAMAAAVIIIAIALLCYLSLINNCRKELIPYCEVVAKYSKPIALQSPADLERVAHDQVHDFSRLEPITVQGICENYNEARYVNAAIHCSRAILSEYVDRNVPRAVDQYNVAIQNLEAILDSDQKWKSTLTIEMRSPNSFELASDRASFQYSKLVSRWAVFACSQSSESNLSTIRSRCHRARGYVLAEPQETLRIQLSWELALAFWALGDYADALKLTTQFPTAELRPPADLQSREAWNKVSMLAFRACVQGLSGDIVSAASTLETVAPYATRGEANGIMGTAYFILAHSGHAEESRQKFLDRAVENFDLCRFASCGSCFYGKASVLGPSAANPAAVDSSSKILSEAVDRYQHFPFKFDVLRVQKDALLANLLEHPDVVKRLKSFDWNPVPHGGIPLTECWHNLAPVEYFQLPLGKP